LGKFLGLTSEGTVLKEKFYNNWVNSVKLPLHVQLFQSWLLIFSLLIHTQNMSMSDIYFPFSHIQNSEMSNWLSCCQITLIYISNWILEASVLHLIVSTYSDYICNSTICLDHEQSRWWHSVIDDSYKCPVHRVAKSINWVCQMLYCLPKNKYLSLDNKIEFRGVWKYYGCQKSCQSGMIQIILALFAG